MFNKDRWDEILEALTANKFRTFLTAFGVFWGITILVLLLALTNGLKNGVEAGFSDFATNSMFTWVQRTSIPYKGLPKGRRFNYKIDDVDAIKAEFPELKYVSPRNSLGGYRGGNNVTRGTKIGAFQIYGDYPEFINQLPMDILQGRFISYSDINSNRKVCVIGIDVVRSLYDKGEDIMGSYIKINGVNPNTYIKPDNDSYWVIGSDRRSSWVDDIPEDNPLTEGVWWDLTKPDKLQISLDAEVAKNLNIKLGDVFTLNIYGREIDGEIVNFRAVDYRDLSINFAMLFNPQFANNIPHEYLATAKFEMIDKFDETSMLEVLPSLSMIKIADYLNKVTDVLNKVFIAVTLISAVTIIIGLIVISSAIMVQGKIKEYQNLVFKILGFSKKEVILSSLIEFVIIFKSVILIAIFFAVIASKFIMENIFELVWAFDFKVLFNLGLSIGLVTLALIMITNLKYLNPKVYPLIRNQ